VLGGEPGIGKSRITQALRDKVADEPHTRLRYQCSPYHTNSALHPVIEQLERAAGFTREDTPEQKLDKLEPLFPDDTARALVAALLSLPVERYPALAMSPQKQKEETLRVLAQQVTALAATEPVLLIFEDAHWIDPTSQELLDLIVPAVAGHRVLAVITHRPEYTPPWTGQGHVAPLVLQRLGKAEAAVMVAQVSERSLSDDILDQIVAKTDGVPLFVEELTKTVEESGAETANAIPETLQDSLMARLDRLSPVKEVAQIGACIGREFSHELLAAVSPLGGNELGEALQQLVNSELIYCSGNDYVFKHALVQDSAYESLLKSRRQQLHQTIATVLQESFSEAISTQPELIAHHLARAGFHDQALTQWISAAQMVLARSSYLEAVGHIESGLDSLSKIDQEPARTEAEITLQTLLGLANASMSGFGAEQTGKAFLRAETLLGPRVSSLAAALPLWPLASYFWNKGDFQRTRTYFDQLRAIGDREENELITLMGQVGVGAMRFHQGEGAESLEMLESALKTYSPERHRSESIQLGGYDIVQMIHPWTAITNAFLGRLDVALVHVERTVEDARDSRHPLTLGYGLSMGALACAEFGFFEKAQQLSDEVIDVAESQSMPTFLGWSKIAASRGRALQGNPGQAIEDLEWARGFMEAIGSRQGLGYITRFLAEAYLASGDIEQAKQNIVQLDDYIAESGEIFHSPMSRILAAQAMSAGGEGDVTRIEEVLSDGLRIAQAQKYVLSELRAATSLARLWQSQGKAAEAHDLLAPVYGWFTEGFDTPDLIDAKVLLHDLAIG